VIGCNRTGQEPSLKSGEAMPFPGDGRIIDPTGEILASGSGSAGAVVADIELRKVRTMRRILPVQRDQRPSVYRRMFEESWPDMTANSREGKEPLPDDE
jgi:predicted amidohydrolase